MSIDRAVYTAGTARVAIPTRVFRPSQKKRRGGSATENAVFDMMVRNEGAYGCRDSTPDRISEGTKAMMIYPTIELQNGRCVSLHRGRLDEPQIWHVDPVETARKYAAAGANWLHVTDFDAVAGNEATNESIVRDIIRAVGIPVQYGGGIKSREQIEHWVDAGAGRVVISSAAVTQPRLVKDAAHAHPDQIAVAVDVFKGRVMSGGWTETTAYEPDTFIASFAKDPLAALIVTDIDADIDAADASLSLITRLAGLASAPVIARGTVRSLDDISRLKYVPSVSGTIIGRALFDKSVNLSEAVAVANAGKEATAPFI